MSNEKRSNLKVFLFGFDAGVLFAGIIIGIVAGFIYQHNKDRGIVEYAEKQMEIEALREDYGNRDTAEFLDELPDVRRAADGAAADFDRKRDEILQRFRSGLADR